MPVKPVDIHSFFPDSSKCSCKIVWVLLWPCKCPFAWNHDPSWLRKTYL